MADLAHLLGALLITFLVSRLVRRLAFRKAAGLRLIVGPNLTTLLIATIIGGFGFADGGAPRFGAAFMAYLLPVIIWIAVDAIRERQKRAPSAI